MEADSEATVPVKYLDKWLRAKLTFAVEKLDACEPMGDDANAHLRWAQARNALAECSGSVDALVRLGAFLKP